MLEALYRKKRFAGIGVLAPILLVVAIAEIRAQDQQESTQNITYLRGQAVIPSYEGWHPNQDGTIDLWFGYLNLNWQEELDIPVGNDNLIEPAEYGADAGQPTHFRPRTNHWEFAIRVPKDFGSKEIVWTLTSHGRTYKTYATLKPGYIHDDMGMQREFYGSGPPPGNKAPVLTVDGGKQRTIRVDQPLLLTAISTDDGIPRASGDTDALPAKRRESGGIAVGGDSVRGVARGLRLAWYVYRGAANLVTFDPPQFKVWEDQRGGSPWSPSWVNPPIPPENKWMVRATFQVPGTYVIRCRASDGFLNTDENITVTVVP